MPLARLRALAFAISPAASTKLPSTVHSGPSIPRTPASLLSSMAVGWPQTQGRFTNFQGKIAIDFNNPRASSVSFKVFAASVDVGSSSFKNFLRGEQFFNVANHPYISFVSTRAEKVDARHAHVTGTPTLLGVTKPVSLDVEVDRKLAGTGQRVGFKAPEPSTVGMNSGYPAISETVHLIVTTEVVGEP
jgi:polyisoprenoid-binding protein YceI